MKRKSTLYGGKCSLEKALCFKLKQPIPCFAHVNLSICISIKNYFPNLQNPATVLKPMPTDSVYHPIIVWLPN